jgi:hypothetical protein
MNRDSMEMLRVAPVTQEVRHWGEVTSHPTRRIFEVTEDETKAR